MTEELTEIVRLELACSICGRGLWLIRSPRYALQQFLLTHDSGRQTVLIECVGTHEEEGSDSDGNKTTSIVTDFHLPVDVLSALLPAATYGAPIWVVADEEPAKRADIGAKSTMIQTHHLKHLPTSKQDLRHSCEEKQLPSRESKDSKTVSVHLLFPGDRLHFENTSVCAIQDFSDSDLTPPTKTLADWAEEYCASWSPLKEFRFIRTVYGWDLNEIQRQVASSMGSCHSGDGKKETATVIINGTKS
ncbi:hypothetical protein M407DRAFT_24959 [Tulasnella calospora MUT 4182]|uniref:Uncharacterized protein n=1 Tax=Tulasnella calospora MUT 4182 TaxID=1051891 RepID=A0A0C3LWC7_9AGAM|nr:hypothetical protein M407DRAFT_24959 [Tulasnella calospora MUT 4182]